MTTIIAPSLYWVVKPLPDGRFTVERQDGSVRYGIFDHGTAQAMAAWLNRIDKENL